MLSGTPLTFEIDFSKLVPAGVATHCIYIQDHEGELNESYLPPQLHRAVRSRKLQFLAGRYCARQALRVLGASCADQPIGMRPDRSPQWPSGYVGSISHTHEIALAAVATASQFISLGVDVEAIPKSDTLVHILPNIASPSEFELFRLISGLEQDVAATVIFSAKESVFKCLSPIIGRFIDFHEVEIRSSDPPADIYEAHIFIPEASASACPTLLTGHFLIASSFVFTAVTLLREST